LFYVIDNFLPQDYFKQLQDLVIYNDNFAYYLSKGKVVEEDDDYQFTHVLVDRGNINSDYYDNFVPIFQKLNAKKIQRAKINLQPKSANIELSRAHVDYIEGDIKACVFYLNTNNGFTYFGEDKVYSVENRIVLFNGNHLHGGSTCTDHNVRVVLNINYF
jgi:hypothetical protein